MGKNITGDARVKCSGRTNFSETLQFFFFFFFLYLFFRVLTNAVASYENLVQLSFFKKAENLAFVNP